MQSFRTELENPVVEKEIIELERKIRAFREGSIPEEKFKSLRLARGIYGQRQPGVQMVRIKLPFGKATFKQLLRISDISDEYAIRNLHFTTRQDIQIHFVSLDRTPELWAKLAEDDVTIREACGNTVRNVTASPEAGIDPEEPFDVSPYAHATFSYFLRNPICQELGRKFKFGFSSSSRDTAFAFGQDLGFIPRIRIVNGIEERGFRVVLGGGLGAQPMAGHVVNEFLPEDQLIPYSEAVLRTFDRYGERNNRNKARFKYLIQKLGLEEVKQLIEDEQTASKVKTFTIDRNAVPLPTPPELVPFEEEQPSNNLAYEVWEKTNVWPQKQVGFYAVYVKVPTGDLPTASARELLAGIRGHVADEVRITQNQGLLLKFARKESLPHIYNVLAKIGFAKPGFDSVADVTTCPGTDTCNLGISNSTEMARVLESLIYDEYDELVYDRELKIKISGCMNSCGQHGIAHIGIHGSSLKAAGKVVPAAQIMLGGGVLGDGDGRVAERVIKVPSKRVVSAVRLLLDDFAANTIPGELFHDYYLRQTKDYFYRMLKPLADLATLVDDEFVDWGHQETYQQAIGVGECAGVVIDLVSVLLFEAEEKLAWANESYRAGSYADAIYHAYSMYISAAKALLLDKGIHSSTQIAIIKDFDTNFVESGEYIIPGGFAGQVLEINKNEPSEDFARQYLAMAIDFHEVIAAKRSATTVINS
ncbi:ferredoxin--nitrite reductase [Parapedobacter pyrenivorans]|uniref:Ferredoxin--nitrite reductase n=1 Tax=Parapedobacter pyrenivorans TaxID=1305674 RepID=A0A917MDR6_9SPHI|nr:HEPN domain-containing protein [Parapedobacter pyrenivorans]GGG97629.1 ferredoxin--nitrite reductase [Parapedobacter pyrenivorans]